MQAIFARIPEQLYRKVRAYAAWNDKKIKEVLEEALEAFLEGSRTRTQKQHRPRAMEKAHEVARRISGHKEVTRRELEPVLRDVCGIDPRTHVKYLRVLVGEGVLVPVARGVWRVNHEGGWLPYHVEA